MRSAEGRATGGNFPAQGKRARGQVKGWRLGFAGRTLLLAPLFLSPPPLPPFPRAQPRPRLAGRLDSSGPRRALATTGAAAEAAPPSSRRRRPPEAARSQQLRAPSGGALIRHFPVSLPQVISSILCMKLIALCHLLLFPHRFA